ncbi:hypothetical protein CspeluHIS016_0202530 [Cutaneotrichosporon spelunceum]|uniref:N-acetyltransferase domain-containing protein n=1 Tax=Cutaneotrichosporon spelunceum TaxID=1672016 RepID=A0AAD3TRK3_9TREE|nr:hypothetical protein CspeluHIS016_0202530 [Cutaneotrichosporon spelunceum]
MPPKLTLVTNTSSATVDTLAASYVDSFSLDTFYPAAAQFTDVSDAAHWHALQFRQAAYASLANPGHEVWCILGDGVGGVEGRDVAAVFVLKLPGCPPDAPTPYDAELVGLPSAAKARFDELRRESVALTHGAWPRECFHISWLGVAAAYQKRGLAGALMRMALRRAAEAGGSVRLDTHTAKNVGFYKHLGFREMGYGEWEIAGVPHTFWIMVAEPQPAGDK